MVFNSNICWNKFQQHILCLGGDASSFLDPAEDGDDVGG